MTTRVCICVLLVVAGPESVDKQLAVGECAVRQVLRKYTLRVWALLGVLFEKWLACVKKVPLLRIPLQGPMLMISLEFAGSEVQGRRP